MTCWLLDELLTESAYQNNSIEDVAKKLGHQVYKTKYTPFSDQLSLPKGVGLDNGQCVITHGTVQFCKQIEKHYGKWWTPGMYFNANVKNWSKFAPYIGDNLLNADFHILPFGNVRSRLQFGQSVFIKPESGLKEFVGQVIHYDTLDDDLKKLSPYNDIDPTTLCVIASPKDIKAEFRYVIVNQKVITGSEYRWDNILDVRCDTHPLCDTVAKKIAEADWQADSVYVCDVALIEGNLGQCAKVIELNAFSSSGLYACNIHKIVEAVSEAAEKEHRGEV